MSLSNEAIVNLRPPVYLGLEAPPPSHKPCPLKWLNYIGWFVTHSTLAERAAQRNVRVEVRSPEDFKPGPASDSPQSGAASHPLPEAPAVTCTVTWQARAPAGAAETVGDVPIAATEATLRPLDFHSDDGTATRFASSSDPGSAQLEILAWGFEGQLESWMIDEGDGWIADSSGERRPDWRDRYVVVYYPPTSTDELGTANGQGAIEIWDHRAQWNRGRLSKETIQKIVLALEGVENDEFRALVARLVDVPLDRARK